MTITLLSDQDTGFENKARVRKLPLQVFTAPDAQKLETEKQNKKETEASLNVDNDTYNGPECSQEQIELVLREKEKILEEARITTSNTPRWCIATPPAACSMISRGFVRC